MHIVIETGTIERGVHRDAHGGPLDAALAEEGFLVERPTLMEQRSSIPASIEGVFPTGKRIDIR